MASARLRGHLNIYLVGSVAEIDDHLARLTARWAALQKTARPAKWMREQYQDDIDLLLDARMRLLPRED